MNKYLLKIKFDCNDADYVYGTTVINETEKELIEQHLDLEISLGNYDGGGSSNSLSTCITIIPITEEESNILSKLGLNSFGEGKYILDQIIDKLAEIEEEED